MNFSTKCTQFRTSFLMNCFGILKINLLSKLLHRIPNKFLLQKPGKNSFFCNIIVFLQIKMIYFNTQKMLRFDVVLHQIIEELT